MGVSENTGYLMVPYSMALIIRILLYWGTRSGSPSFGNTPDESVKFATEGLQGFITACIFLLGKASGARSLLIKVYRV